jgi:hypothetical protein
LKVQVGTVIYRKGAYILDKYLTNQKSIQEHFPDSELVIASAEKDFIHDLEHLLKQKEIRSRIITYEVVKPDYARDRIWNITCGREAIRRDILSRHDTELLLFLDADMTYDPRIIEIMYREIQGHKVIFSGVPRKDFGIGMAGAGCLMLTRDILKRINFRCYEFQNSEIISEDNVLEMDLFQRRIRIKKGLFVAMDHYLNSVEYIHLDPGKIGLLRKMVNNGFIRYCLIRFSITLHCDVPSKLRNILHRFTTQKKHE